MAAYETCRNATSTHQAPWYVVPADDKENARLIPKGAAWRHCSFVRSSTQRKPSSARPVGSSLSKDPVSYGHSGKPLSGGGSRRLPCF